MREKLEQKPSFSPLASQVSQLEQAIYEKLVYSVGRQPERAARDWFMATAPCAIRSSTTGAVCVRSPPTSLPIYRVSHRPAPI